MKQFDIKLLSMYFHLGFEYNHHAEYMDKVINFIDGFIVWRDDVDFFEFIKRYDEVKELLRDDLYHNDPAYPATYYRSHERLVELFDERLQDFVESDYYIDLKERA